MDEQGRKGLAITPETKLGEILERHPEVEQTLIAMSPEFRRLKNPVLRATVAKLATLGQVARVGGIGVADLVTALRAAVRGGDPAWENVAPEGCPASPESPGPSALESPPPRWFDSARIARTLDARPMIEAGRHPLPEVVEAAQGLAGEQILELVTPFEPAPLIDQLRRQGFQVWGERRGARDLRTYFRRA